MKNEKKYITPWACILPIAFAVGLTACGGGGGGDTTPDLGNNTAKAYTLPSELSAVPAATSNPSSSPQAKSFSDALNKLSKAVSDLPSDSDYHTEKGSRYVDENALQVFDIFETIFKAVSQTNYSDAAVVDQGPYRAMVAWDEENDAGVASKKLQEWVIDSKLATDATFGQYNLVNVWIEESMPGMEKTIKVQFKVFNGAEINEDGEAITMGDWDIYADFGAPGSFFFAEARTTDGVSVLKMKEAAGSGGDVMSGDMTMPDTVAQLVRSTATGYGKVQVPDWDACMMDFNSCMTSVPTAELKYAYNEEFLGIQEPSGDEEYKFRNPSEGVKLVHHYGLYLAEGANAGDNVLKHVNFGFPVEKLVTDQEGTYTLYGYYGGWQGRHQLWGFESANLQVGDTVLKQDYSGGSSNPIPYTVGKITEGTFSKRDLVDASLADIKGIISDTHFNKHANLHYYTTANDFQLCDGFIDYNMATEQEVCNGTTINFQGSDIEALLNEADSKSYWVDIWSNAGMLTYSSGSFYDEAQSVVNFQDGDWLSINVGGMVIIKYVGFPSDSDALDGGSSTGFIQLTETENDVTGAITFSNPTTYTVDRKEPLFIHANGSNFIVNVLSDTPSSAADYSVQMEQQSTANPQNASAFLPTGTSYLAYPWDKSKQYSFNGTELTVNDENGMVTQDVWGLHAYNNNGTTNDTSDDLLLTGDGATVLVDSTGMPDFTANGFVEPAQFNWEYANLSSENRDTWKSMTFLKDSEDNWSFISDPIRLNPAPLVDSAGNDKGTSKPLMYEGFLHGLPDIYMELADNNWELTDTLREKVVFIPEGTELTNAVDNTKYYIKPLDTSIILGTDTVNTDRWPDLTAANGITLSEIDNLVPTNVDIGTKPTDEQAPVKFVEGEAVE